MDAWFASLTTLVAMSCASSPLEAQIYTRTTSDGVIEATNMPDSSGFLLIYPGKGTLIHSRGFSRNYRGQFDTHINDASAEYGVAAGLIKAVIQVESEFDHLAVSSKGAQGLMQLMPFTARRFGVTNSFDPRQNIFGGTQFFVFCSISSTAISRSCWQPITPERTPSYATTAFRRTKRRRVTCGKCEAFSEKSVMCSPTRRLVCWFLRAAEQKKSSS